MSFGQKWQNSITEQMNSKQENRTNINHMIKEKRGTTLIKQNKARYKYFRELNQRVLGFTEESYFWMLFEKGNELIRHEACETEEFIQEILYTEGYFWPWFVNQWNIADEEFVFRYELEKIDEVIAQSTRDAILENYMKFHHDRLYSNDTERGYMHVISELVKSSTHA
jgi:hypothetical protein